MLQEWFNLSQLLIPAKALFFWWEKTYRDAFTEKKSVYYQNTHTSPVCMHAYSNFVYRNVCNATLRHLPKNPEKFQDYKLWVHQNITGRG